MPTATAPLVVRPTSVGRPRWAEVDAVVLRAREGTTIPLEVHRWRGPADAVERALVASLPDAVIDIGCGPGRMVEAVAESGRRALGIDPSDTAAREAAGRGVAVLRRSVFEPLPGEGRWGAALLLDGNIGIGGDPVRLLRRVAALLRPGGVVVVEVEPPGEPTCALDVRLERATDEGALVAVPGPWFPWARVGADGVEEVVERAGLRSVPVVVSDGRWLARAVRP